jgi:hypothetical protein
MKMNFLDAIEGNSMNKHPRIIPDSDIDEPFLRAERAVENVLAEACTIIRQKGQVTITERMVHDHTFQLSLPGQTTKLSLVEETVHQVAIVRPRVVIQFHSPMLLRHLAWDAMSRARVKGKPVVAAPTIAELSGLIGESNEIVASDLNKAMDMGLITTEIIPFPTITIEHRDWIWWLDRYALILIDTEPTEEEVRLVGRILEQSGQKVSSRDQTLFATFLKVFPHFQEAIERLKQRFARKSKSIMPLEDDNTVVGTHRAIRALAEQLQEQHNRSSRSRR